MANVATIPITNIYMGGDYTGRILVGPEQKALNLLLDTGSSALAIDVNKYQPDIAGGDRTTELAQTDSYGDGSSWTGAVIKTKLTIGDGDAAITLPDGNAAIAYTSGGNMWGNTDGILGLAYAPLDDAFQMPGDSWQNKYSEVQVRTGKQGTIQPYLTQLAGADVTSDIISFITRRSFVHVGGGDDDPLNQGVMIVGGGEEMTKLYTGSFQTVKVLSDTWYCTSLKSIKVGSSDPIIARIDGPQGMPSNSIVDSGTNSLSLSPQLLAAFISKFNTEQQGLLNNAVTNGQLISVDALNLASWPTVSFVLQGDTDDVTLNVAPSDYWQVNTQDVGAAAAAITSGQAGLAILGLPLMNGYFTIFDGEADGGKGVVKFATRAD